VHQDPKAGTATGSQEDKIDPRHEQQQTPKIALKDDVDLSPVGLKKKKKKKTEKVVYPGSEAWPQNIKKSASSTAAAVSAVSWDPWPVRKGSQGGRASPPPVES
jgi:hypothetical protein